MPVIQRQLFQRQQLLAIQRQRTFRIGLGHRQSPSGSKMAGLSSFQYGS
jgi:hypothetical protein